MAKTPIEQKIALLLVKAESTSSPHEAEALQSAAEKLMIKHGIEQAVIAAQGAGTVKPEDIVQKTIDLGGIYDAAWVQLGVAVVNGLGSMKILASRMYHKKGTKLYVIGYAGDVDRAIQLFDSLKVQAETAMRFWYKAEGQYLYSTDNGYKNRREFIIAFAHTVGGRLARERAQAVMKVGTGTELVLRDRGRAVAQWVDENHGPLRHSRSRTQGGSMSATFAGRAAGTAASADTSAGSLR